MTERPERLSLKVLMALLDILGCAMDDLVEPVAAVTPGRKARAAGGGDAGVGGLRPKRARITRAGELTGGGRHPGRAGRPRRRRCRPGGWRGAGAEPGRCRGCGG